MPRAPLALALVPLLLLAGCLGGAGDPAAPAGAGDGSAPAPEGAGPSSETRVGEAPVDDGTRTDLGHMPHMHDYWMGRERVTLFDGEVTPSFDPFWTGFTLFFANEAQAGSTPWFLPDGQIVYEGTGLVEFTAAWTDPAVTSLAMVYQTPDGKDWNGPVALPNGETVSLDVTPEMTDMPHAKTSRWAFWFAPDGHGAALGPFNLKVDIVKMRDIAMFPPHPELFEGKPEKVLDDAEHAFDESSYAKRAPNLLTSGDFGEKEVAPQQLVPMETLWMRVEVDLLEASATPGQVADVRFFYHGADRAVISHPFLLPVEGSVAEKRLVYAFPVSMEETDTPYGDESQWRFFVEPTTTFTGQEGEPDCGGCTDVHIKYHMKVIAYDHVPEGAEESERSG